MGLGGDFDGSGSGGQAFDGGAGFGGMFGGQGSDWGGINATIHGNQLMQDITNDTLKGALLSSLLGGVTSWGSTLFDGSRSLSQARNDMTSLFGKEASDSFFSNYFEGWGDDSTPGPDDLKEEMTRYSTGPNLTRSFADDFASGKLDDDKMDDYLKLAIMMRYGTTSDDLENFWSYQHGRSQFDASQGMGVPSWWQQFMTNYQFAKANPDYEFQGNNGGNTNMPTSNFSTPQETIVRGLYQSLFGRDNPDQEGVQYWSNMLTQGTSVDDVRDAMQQAGAGYENLGNGTWRNTSTGDEVKDSVPYSYDPDKSPIWEDYVNTFYDQMLKERQNQSDQYRDTTDRTTDRNADILSDQRDAITDFGTRQDSLLDEATSRQDDLLSALMNNYNRIYNTSEQDQKGYVDELRDRQDSLFDTASTNRDSYLDRLIESLDATNSGNLPTVTRDVGGQTLTWVPRANRDAANMDRQSALDLFGSQWGSQNNLLNTGTDQAQNLANAGLDASRYLSTLGSDMSQNVFDSGYNSSRDRLVVGTDQARRLMDANNQYVNDSLDTNQQDYLNNMALASEGNPTINYLNDLAKLIGIEATKSASDKSANLDRDRLDASIDAQEPGMLDYLKGAGTAASSIGSLLEGLSKLKIF